MASATGRTLAFSGAAGIIAFLLSLLIDRPAAVRSGQLVAAVATAPENECGRLASEAASLRRRGGIASFMRVTMLALAAAGMSVARYV